MLIHTASALAVYASRFGFPTRARLASGGWLTLAGWDSNPLDFNSEFQSGSFEPSIPTLQALPGATALGHPAQSARIQHPASCILHPASSISPLLRLPPSAIPGRDRRLPACPPHRPVRARLTHTVPQVMASLRELVDNARRRQGVSLQQTVKPVPRHRFFSGAAAQPLMP